MITNANPIMQMTPIPLLLSAGEASGDMYAARLATALKQRADVEIFGMGGPQMRAAGVDIVTDYSEVSVVGITEILSHLPSLIRAMRHLVSEAERRRPQLAILTDFPGFHLRLARKLKARKIRNAYYICPQFWAWRPWRVRIVRRRFAEALCIFPFEEKFYADAGVPVKFIGHPLVGAVHATVDRPTFLREQQLNPALPVVAVLPGSRRAELNQHLPILRAACAANPPRNPSPIRNRRRSPQQPRLTPRRLVARTPAPHRRRPHLRRPRLRRRRYRLQRHRNRRNRTPRRPHGRRLPRNSPHRLARQAPRSHTFLQHGESNRWEARSARTDSERFHARARLNGSAATVARSVQREPPCARIMAEVRNRLGPPGAVDRAADAILDLVRDDRVGATQWQR